MSFQQSSINTQPDWTIIQISDTHLMDREELEFARMNPEQSFHEVMQQIQQRFPQMDALIHTGDLAQVPVARDLSTLFSICPVFKRAVLSDSR